MHNYIFHELLITSEGVFYIGGRGFVYIETVTFARCAFIFALRNIALGGYLDKRRNINCERSESS